MNTTLNFMVICDVISVVGCEFTLFINQILFLSTKISYYFSQITTS